MGRLGKFPQTRSNKVKLSRSLRIFWECLQTFLDDILDFREDFYLHLALLKQRLLELATSLLSWRVAVSFDVDACRTCNFHYCGTAYYTATQLPPPLPRRIECLSYNTFLIKTVLESFLSADLISQHFYYFFKAVWAFPGCQLPSSDLSLQRYPKPLTILLSHIRNETGVSYNRPFSCLLHLF